MACLEGLWTMAPAPDRIIVVDNGSGDASGEGLLLRARERLGPAQAVRTGPKGREDSPTAYPAFSLLTLPENRGYAAALNAALGPSLAGGPEDFFLLLNSDILMRAQALAALLQCAATRPDTGVFGATILAGRGAHLECAGGCRYVQWATVTRPCLAGLSLTQATARPEPRLDYVHGACMFVRKAVFQAAGLFDERFFLFGEELDFCLRAKNLGFGLGWCREAIASHAGGASLRAGFPDERGRKLLANYHENLGALMIAKKWSGALFPLAVSWRFFGKLAVLAARGETYLAASLFSAFKDYFLKKSPYDPRSG